MNTKELRYCHDVLTDAFMSVRYTELELSVTTNQAGRMYLLATVEDQLKRMQLLEEVLRHTGHFGLVERARANGYKKAEEYFTKLNGEKEND